jgi:DNA-binding transcriptional MerR regulator
MKIGALAVATRTKVETIRFYEAAGLLPAPARTHSNYRSYTPVHLERLSFIRRARDLGFSLDDVRELLNMSDDREQSCEAVDALAKNHLRAVELKIGDLRRIGAELTRIIGECKQGHVGTCKIIETLLPA